jgi:hypothetical protein
MCHETVKPQLPILVIAWSLGPPNHHASGRLGGNTNTVLFRRCRLSLTTHQSLKPIQQDRYAEEQELRTPYSVFKYQSFGQTLLLPTFPVYDWAWGRVSRYGIVMILSIAARGILQGGFPVRATDFLSATSISHPPILYAKGRRTLLVMYGNLW